MANSRSRTETANAPAWDRGVAEYQHLWQGAENSHNKQNHIRLQVARVRRFVASDAVARAVVHHVFGEVVS